MYGLIGQIEAKPGKGPELARILSAGSKNMAGNMAYIVAIDKTNQDLIWVTEIWDSPEDHKASLALDSVKAAIEKGRSMIEGFRSQNEVLPVP